MRTEAVFDFPPAQPWRSNDIEVIPQSRHIGAEVRGVDLANFDDRAFGVIHDAWLKHLVLVFRDQALSDADQIAFSRRFGTLDLAPLDEQGRRGVPAHPEILIISNVVENGRPIGALGAGESVWHIDMSYNPVPAKASALYALEVPPSGGDTGFLSCYAACEALPDDLRRRIETVGVKHDATLNSAGNRRYGVGAVTDVSTSPGAVHPAIHTHPETGRDALYLGRRRYAHIEGMPVAESEALLDELWAHTTQEAFTWHHTWRNGDLVLWDNRCVMHRRDAFDGAARRVMHRTQIQGEKPVRHS
jgi:alpha-ketoglutarate-dependent taurine dioxygenase